VEIEGADHPYWAGNTDDVLEPIERFLIGSTQPRSGTRVLATVLFTDIVASTEQLAARGDEAWRLFLDRSDATTHRIVSAHRGQVVRHTGDGVLATFDGPAHAVRCAAALLHAANSQGITLRAGPTRRRDRTPPA
jgi:class 3 adenylate cyclase